jgi:hypothetical protein
MPSPRAESPEDVLLKAMQDELARSIAQLQLEKLEKPYYIDYAVVDTDTFQVQAAFGAAIKSDRERNRLLRVDVRVGNYDLDNSDFIGSRSLLSAVQAFPRQLVLDDDYAALRQDLWLATDATYKQALEQLAEKRAFIQNKVQTEPLPDFSREEATKTIAPRRPLTYDQAKWQEVVRRLSAIFRDYPAIQDSKVSLRVQVAHKYFVNSEGSIVGQPAPLVSLHARATAQAPDGMQLKHFVPFYGASLDQLPSESEMMAAIRQMAEQLTALASAPVLENYSGPVLLTGQAAAELFAQVLAPQLSGHRPPLLEQQLLAMMFPKNELADRLNRPVLPSFLTAVDDPTQATYHQRPLIGAYPVDDQGVKAQAVTLIDHGVLKALLMSRRPRKEIARSNGHGRAMPLGSPSAQIGNLLVQSTDGKSFAQLKQALITRCRAQGLSFGLLIKTLDNPSITGKEFSFSPLMMAGGLLRESLAAPVLVYKVSVEDGREELVRGLTVSQMSVRALKDIAAAGSDYYIDNRLTTSGGGLMGVVFAFAAGFEEFGAEGIPTTVIAPSVLFEELELKRTSGQQQTPALLERPSFTK